MQDLTGLTGVVTGGGGGIGREIMLELARCGMKVAALDIKAEAAEAVAAECAAFGVRAAGFKCDVTVAGEIEAAAAQVRAELGPVNLIWANAGVTTPPGEGILGAARAALRWVYAVNVEGVIDTLRAFLPAMIADSGWRHVGITGSVAGLVQTKPTAATVYSASKFATVGIAEALRAELLAERIGVTLLCPGVARTRLWDGGRARPERFGGPVTVPDSYGDRFSLRGVDAREVAAYGVEAARRGDFYAVMPETDERGAEIESRVRAITASLRMPAKPGGS